jgi:hypothetical protein
MNQRALRLTPVRRTSDSYVTSSNGLTALALAAITPRDVRAWHGHIVNSDLNRNTVAKVYGLFRNLMGTATNDDVLRVNPVNINGGSRRALHRTTATAMAQCRPTRGVHPPTLQCFGLDSGELRESRTWAVNVGSDRPKPSATTSRYGTVARTRGSSARR